MPTVPIDNTPSEKLRPIAAVRQVAPQSDLPRIGAALASAGGVASGIAVHDQELENADRLFRAEAGLRDEYLKFEAGLRQRRGQDAWGVTNDVTSWFDERGPKYADGFDNDVQRRLFEPMFTRMREQSIDTASRYEGQERRVSLEQSAQASIATAINVAAASHENDAAIDSARGTVLERIGVQADINGWTPERVALEQSTQLTNLHRQVLQAMVDKDPERAREYFAAHKDEIAGAERDGVEQIVRLGGLRALAQRESDKLMTAGMTEAETLRTARDKFEGEERDQIEQRIKTQFAERDAAKQKREREVSDAAWNIFARGGLSAIPTALLDELDGRTLQSMKSAESGVEAKTNWDTYYTLEQMAANDPARFAQTDLRQFFPQLAPGQRTSLINRQQNPVPDVASWTQQLAVAHDQLELKADDDKGRFNSVANDALDQSQKLKGQPLTYAEREEVLDHLMINGTLSRDWWFDKSVRRYQTVGTPEERRFHENVEELEGFYDLSTADQEELRRLTRVD